jgi:AAA domain-containing protein
VLEVEADLAARLAARGTHHGIDADLRPDLWNGTECLDAGQAAAAAPLAGPRPLVVVEGAAGAGKTTPLAATRELLAHQGRGLLVVTPTVKAAKVAAAEVGTAAGSAAWLALEHGCRWSSDGAWTRLALGDVDPATGVPYAGPRETALASCRARPTRRPSPSRRSSGRSGSSTSRPSSSPCSRSTGVRPGDWLFSNAGAPLNRNSAGHQWRQVRKAAELDG